jgi:hypothetical protein
MEEKDNLSITMYCPGSFLGSNFRNNSLSGANKATTSKHALTLE